jgi:hypothetical protein
MTLALTILAIYGLIIACATTTAVVYILYAICKDLSQ